MRASAATLAAGGTLDREQARNFFEDNFKPVRILPAVTPTAITPAPTASTPAITRPKSPARASRPTNTSVPLYRRAGKTSTGKKSKVFAQYDRTEIEDGALAGKGLEICYVKNPVDAFFAQIQGSTRVKLDDGELLRLNYIASNGKPYTPVGRFLIDRGIYTPEEMSMDKIRD